MSNVAARINARLDALTACLCGFLTPEGDTSPPMCMCQRIPGTFPGETYAGEGEDMAWVRIAQIYPSVSVGQVSQQVGNLRGGTGFDVELGVMRCFEIDKDAEWDLDLLADLSVQTVNDAAAMMKTVACCTGPPEDPWSLADWIVGPWQPLGPAGNMTGGTLTVFMAL